MWTRSREDTRRGGDGRSGVGHSGEAGGTVPGAPAPDAGRRRLAPVLLSLLVFPGLGQLATGRPWRGLAYAGGSVWLLAALVRRVYAEASRLLPADDPDALLDPALPFRLAAEIHRANASFFGWVTAGIVVLWALSAAEAWVATRRAGGSPARRVS